MHAVNVPFYGTQRKATQHRDNFLDCCKTCDVAAAAQLHRIFDTFLVRVLTNDVLNVAELHWLAFVLDACGSCAFYLLFVGESLAVGVVFSPLRGHGPIFQAFCELHVGNPCTKHELYFSCLAQKILAVLLLYSVNKLVSTAQPLL